MGSNPWPELVLGCKAATALRHPLSLATVPVISPFLLPALRGVRGSLPMAMSQRGWQGVGSLGKIPGSETPDQMPGALSCSIPGCCTHSCRGSLGCKPHHMHLLQGEINQSYTCNVIPTNRFQPLPLICSSFPLAAFPSCIPVCCKDPALSKHSLLHIYVQCLVLLA